MEKIVIIALFGLSWGSFLNVVIYRLPRGLSIIHPPSFCPHCQSRIRFYDNIPLLSYIILKGKCRACKSRISLTYLLVELITPLSFILLHIYHSLSLFFFASCLFSSLLIVLAFIDYSHQILPDEITLPGLLFGVTYSLFRKDLNLTQSLTGAVVGAGFLLFMYGAYYVLRKKEGLGMGDVTMMLMIGSYLGWKGALLTLIIASFSGAAWGVFLILIKKKSLQFSLPFGTFLSPGAYLSLLFGQRIITTLYR